MRLRRLRACTRTIGSSRGLKSSSAVEHARPSTCSLIPDARPASVSSTMYRRKRHKLGDETSGGLFIVIRASWSFTDMVIE